MCIPKRMLANMVYPEQRTPGGTPVTCVTFCDKGHCFPQELIAYKIFLGDYYRYT